MEAFTLTGNDTYLAEQFIQQHKQILAQNWAIFNFQEFSADRLEEALQYAQTPSLGGQQKILVIRGEIPTSQFELLKTLLSLNTSSSEVDLKQRSQNKRTKNECPTYEYNWVSTLILITKFDARTRIGKLIKSATTVKEFNLTPSWKTNELTTKIQQQSQALGVNLPPSVAAYIANAIGSNSARTIKELEKLATCRGNETLTFGEIKQLIPNLNSSTLELANAIKNRNAIQISQLTQQLLSLGEHPLKITATLLTIFRTWLKLKAALNAGKRNEKDLTKAAGIANPKRLYFLKQEIQGLSTSWLIKSAITLFDLECAIKQGLPLDYFTTHLITLVID